MQNESREKDIIKAQDRLITYLIATIKCLQGDAPCVKMIEEAIKEIEEIKNGK